MPTKWLEVARSEFQDAPTSLTAKTDTTGGSVSFGSAMTVSISKNRDSSNIPFSADDWRAFFDERAGIAEHDGRQPRPEAEALAYQSTLLAFVQNRYPAILGEFDAVIRLRNIMTAEHREENHGT